MGSGVFRPSFDMDNQAIHDVEKGLAAKEEAQGSATSKSQSVTSKSLSAQITVTGPSIDQTGAKVPNDSDDRECESISNRTIRGGLLLPAWVLTVLIVTLGAGTAVAFLAVGITSASQDQEESFERLGADLVKKVQGALEDYVTAASYIHGRCRHRNFTRESFREGYEYLLASGLEFKALQFDPNITHDERYAAEAEAREYYAQYYPHIDYQGFKGFNFVNQTVPEPRVNASFYFPIHYMEPIVGNEAAIDLDYFAEGSPQRHQTVLYSMQHGMPGITERLRLVQETEEVAYGVVLMHPGVNLTTQPDVWPRDITSIVIRIPDLLTRSSRNQGESSIAYLFDSTNEENPVFLGGVQISHRKGYDPVLTQLPEATMENLTSGGLSYVEDVFAENKNWTVVVTSAPGTFQADYTFAILGACIMFVASVLLAYWIQRNSQRINAFNRMRAEADREKAALILENAKQATKAERDLNDFIAHEVRNPVAAAMSACSFVKNAVNESEPLITEESRITTREDVEIIENSLHFVNDLLRNMLDMHRAASKQLKVNMVPTDILHDILEPVESILYQRRGEVQVSIDCPPNLFAVTDRLRLKQIMLNLGRNSSKFVERGFIRLRAEVVDGNVQLCVEDSGPGVPDDKRERLFAKFQESLDSLSQGTGIGLFLCKSLIELMGGEIRLDNDYNSGVPGCVGTRIIVDLCSEPLDSNSLHEYDASFHDVDSGETAGATLSEDDESFRSDLYKLPATLSVLFVDDDAILRKLFTRTVLTVAPNWDIREASNGETALRLVETQSFDLIFMDMYMASVQKQLLGTEAVKALRAKGVSCRICGLSANDKGREFLEAGADAFTYKPFPCAPRPLTSELCRILYADANASNNDASSNSHA